MADLVCCVSFRYTEKSESVIHRIFLSFRFFSHMHYGRVLGRNSVLCSTPVLGICFLCEYTWWSFPGSAWVVKNLPTQRCSFDPESEVSLEAGNYNLPRCACLEDPMKRGLAVQKTAGPDTTETAYGKAQDGSVCISISIVWFIVSPDSSLLVTVHLILRPVSLFQFCK